MKLNSASATTLLAVLVGITVGLGLYTFVYARGYSYLSNNPTACTNCHVMQEYYDAWMKSGHHSVAKCNDCHTPHNFFGKYLVKAENGFNHSFRFTTGWFPDNIEIRPSDAKVTEGTCRSCHQEIVTAILGTHDEGMSCIKCHADVGHSAASFVMESARQPSDSEPAQLVNTEKPNGNRQR
jgi:cytochrome c nitrite reductase small subunit